jgi:hypothetical protein
MYCPCIAGLNEGYHGGTLDLIDIRIKGWRGWIDCPSKPIGNEAYHVGTFDVIDFRIKGDVIECTARAYLQ